MSAERDLWDRARVLLRPDDGTRDERIGYLLSTLAGNAPEALSAALDQLEGHYAPQVAEAPVDPYAILGLRCVHERDGTITTYGPAHGAKKGGAR